MGRPVTASLLRVDLEKDTHGDGTTASGDFFDSQAISFAGRPTDGAARWQADSQLIRAVRCDLGENSGSACQSRPDRASSGGLARVMGEQRHDAIISRGTGSGLPGAVLNLLGGAC